MSSKLAVAACVATFMCGGCNGPTDSGSEPTGPINDTPTWDLSQGLPKIVTSNYIDVTRIERVSKFRSAAGHDYSDDYESERSMKHYFKPIGDNGDTTRPTWGDIPVTAPIDGTVWRIDGEWVGAQLWIESLEHPAFKVILFHVNLATEYALGDTIRAGDALGVHGGDATWSDIAVAVWTTDDLRPEHYGYKNVSVFELMTDSLFNAVYMPFTNVSSRDDFIIPKATRDQFPGFNEFPDSLGWVVLNP